MRLLDLFCGAGGCAVGYHRAGFTDIVGVDINPQPHHPFTFIQADAIEYLKQHAGEFDVIHASPPCQAFSSIAVINGKEYPDLLTPCRTVLENQSVPYVIENVIGAPMVCPVRLCGTMFGLKVYRHRFFESSHHLWEPAHYPHDDDMPVSGHGYSSKGFVCVCGHFVGTVDYARRAMGIDWKMTKKELTQAIPPAYTEYIGRQLIDALVGVE